MIYRVFLRTFLFILAGLVFRFGIEWNPGLALNSCWMSPWIVTPTFQAAPLLPADNLGFQVGERLAYRISWSNFMEAGTAELTVGPGSSTMPNSYRLQLKAVSTAAISRLYSFQDEFVSLFDAGLSAPTRFEKSFVERKREVRETVIFDQFNHSATFAGGKQPAYRVAIDAGTQDPLSALYTVRSLVLKPGLQVVLPVLDGGKNFQLEIKVTGSDLISTALGNFSTHRVEVGLRREGIPLTDKRITIWFTNDTRKVPVLASISLPFGAALIELTSQSK